MSHADRILAQLRRINAAMVATGAPAISPRWWSCLERIIRSGRRQGVIRKGRQVGASKVVFPRLAVAWILASEHVVPDGELLLVACVSVKRSEALRRLRNVRAVLDVVGLHYVERGDELEIPELRRAIVTLTASARTEVGHTIELLWCDEVSRWWSDDASANPASEVLAALRPALATVTDALVLLVSSPLGPDDYHAQQFDLGDTDAQIIDCFPTWEANPLLSEPRTHELEPNQRIWLREYAAIPQAAAAAAFDVDAVDPAFRPVPEGYTPGAAFGVIDFSSGRSDAATWALARWHTAPQSGPTPKLVTRRQYQRRVYDPYCGSSRYEDWTPGPNDFAPDGLPLTGIYHEWQETALDDDGRPIILPRTTRPPLLALESVSAVEGAFWQSLPADELVARMARFFRGRTTSVYGDQRESYLLTSAFAQHDIGFTPITWSNENKVLAVERIRRCLHDGTLIFPDDPPCEKLRAQLYAFQEKITPSGNITFAGRGRTHDDFVALLLTMTMAPALTWVSDDPGDNDEDDAALAVLDSRWANMPGCGC